MHPTAASERMIWRMPGPTQYNGKSAARLAREWGTQLVTHLPPQNMNGTQYKRSYTGSDDAQDKKARGTHCESQDGYR